MMFLTYVILTAICFQSLAADARSLPFLRDTANEDSTDGVLYVYADQDWRTFESRNGFLHGLQDQDTLSDSMVAFLNPRYWRLYKFESYAEAVAHNALITFGTCDHYAWYKGGWEYAKPWLDWDEYEEYLLYELTVFDDYFPDNPPDFYDVWNEPDHPYFWHGTYEQLVETFARTINVIRAFRPDAKIVGPSISWYRPDGDGEENIIELLADLDSIHGLRLDAIAWHENGGVPSYGPGRPEDVYYDLNSVKSAVENYFPPEYQPEYHINEYTGGRVHLSPGWTFAYLFWLDYMDIDFASRACWGILAGDPPEYYSDCWAGLDGLLMRDGITPQPIYWVHRACAELDGMTQLPIGTTHGNTLIMAAKNDSNETLHLIAGRYADSASGAFGVRIEGYPYPYRRAQVAIQRIPSAAQFHWDPPVGMPMPEGPLDFGAEVVTVVDSLIDFPLSEFTEGDVYVIAVLPLNCGDADGNDLVNISDAGFLIAYIFGGGPAPDPLLAGDADCNDLVNISDAVYLITYIFGGAPEPCADCP